MPEALRRMSCIATRSPLVLTLALAPFVGGCAVDEGPTSEPASMPPVVVPVPPPGVEEANARAAELLPNGPAKPTAPEGIRETKAAEPTVTMRWVGADPGASEVPFDGAPLELAVENVAGGPVAVRLEVLFNAGQRARRWSSAPLELPAGGTDVIEIDLAREGVRAEVPGLAVDVRATLQIFLGDDRLDGAADRDRPGALREATLLRLRNRPGGETAASRAASVMARFRAAGVPERFLGGVVAVETLDDTTGAEDAIKE